jgi:DNA-binding transcriptional LysR family regulator
LERLPAQVVFTAHLASVLRTMALDGRGLAWLPETLIGDDLASGRLVEAAPAEWRVELEVRLYRDKAGLGRAAEKFWEAASGTS